MFIGYKLPQSEAQIRSALNIPVHPGMQGEGINWDSIGRSIAEKLNIPTDVGKVKKIAKTVVQYGLPAVSSALAGGASSVLSGGNPLAGVAGSALGGYAGKMASEKVNAQIGNGLKRGRGRPRKDMSGTGWLNKSGILDRSFTARDIIKGAKALPGLAKSAVADVRGAGLNEELMGLAMHGVAGKKVPKVRGLTSGVDVPGLTSGVVPMGGSGMHGKGSEAMRQKMARLRSLRKKK